MSDEIPAAPGRRFVLCSLLALCATASTPASSFAQSRARMGRVLRGAKNYGPRVLTRDDLTACLGHEQDLDTIDNDLAEMSARITQIKQESDARERAIDEQRGALSSPDAIKRYNEMVDEHNSAQQRLGEMIEAYNAKIDAAENLVGRFNRVCAAKDYYEDDLKAARAALGNAAAR